MNTLFALIASLSLWIECQIIQVLRLLLFKPYKAGKHSTNIHHIAIYRVGNFGDTLLVIPALKAIRETFPDSTITLITSSGNPNHVSAQDVLKSFPPYVDRIISYLPEEIKSIKGFSKIKNEVYQAGRVDLFIDLPVTMQTLKRNIQEIFLAKNLNARFAIGFNQIFPSFLKSAYTRQYSHRIPKTADWFLNNLAPYQIEGEPTTNTSLVLANDTLDQLTQKLNGFSPQFNLRQEYLVVCAGAKLAIKQWPVNHFIDVVKSILEKHPTLKVVLLGVSSEADINSAIEHGVNNERIINLCGQTSLEESMIMVQHAKAVLSNDTGTMHVAGVLDIPVVIPLSGQFPNPLWHPVGSNYQLLQHPVPCAPCFFEECPLEKQFCLTEISSVHVTQQVLSQLE